MDDNLKLESGAANSKIKISNTTKDRVAACKAYIESNI
jgi:hypothetical protein